MPNSNKCGRCFSTRVDRWEESVDRWRAECRKCGHTWVANAEKPDWRGGLWW